MDTLAGGATPLEHWSHGFPDDSAPPLTAPPATSTSSWLSASLRHSTVIQRESFETRSIGCPERLSSFPADGRRGHCGTTQNDWAAPWLDHDEEADETPTTLGPLQWPWSESSGLPVTSTTLLLLCRQQWVQRKHLDNSRSGLVTLALSFRAFDFDHPSCRRQQSVQRQYLLLEPFSSFSRARPVDRWHDFSVPLSRLVLPPSQTQRASYLGMDLRRWGTPLNVLPGSWRRQRGSLCTWWRIVYFQLFACDWVPFYWRPCSGCVVG